MTETAVTEVQSYINLSGRYLSFCLSSEEYCVDILAVQQIIQMEEITNVPLTPDFIRGVINLRGKVVPVIDLRIKFGMDISPDTEKTCIAVLQVSEGRSVYTAGIVIDEVLEVSQVSNESISPVPEFGTSIDVTFLKGIVQLTQSVRMIIDIDKIFSQLEFVKASSLQE